MMNIDTVFPQNKELRWVNKQRTLIVSTKGITERAHQLMLDLHNLMPHSKKASKLEKGGWDE
jgi:ribosome biogenesis protein BRX1